ncbi:MAG: ArgE/DapE family deacylase [Halioglobus sp.]|nr:ArgE/DapE family deacylase [Halioglobus sp.]
MATTLASLVDPARLRERLVALVRTPSLTGTEDEGIKRVADWLQETGAEVDYWYDGIAALQLDSNYPGHEVERAWVPVVAGVVRGARPGPAVLLTGHVDTVPPGDYTPWNLDPFCGVVDGDRVYGCGAADMKSGLVAALEAFQVFASGPRDFSGRVIFVAVPAEEDSGLGTLAAIRRGWTADVAIIPEPTLHDGLPQLVIAHAGGMSVTVEVRGLSAHASKRMGGHNALDLFYTLMQAMRDDERQLNESEQHPLMRELALPYPTNVGIIQGGVWSSSVMDTVQAEVRIGVALNETVRGALQRFQSALDRAAQSDPWMRDHPPIVKPHATGFGSSQTPDNHPLVDAMRGASKAVFGEEAKTVGVPYGCDMSGWVRLAGIPTVVYGPGDINLAHAPNETVSLRDTENVARALIMATEELLESDVETLRAARHAVARLNDSDQKLGPAIN